MRPEAARFLENAHEMLARGRRMLAAGLVEDSGRAAQLAAFHAAQALIFERENRTLKTHGGIHSEFAKLIRDDPGVSLELRGFLSRAYAFKTIADYDPLTAAQPTEADAHSALETAEKFVGEIARLTDQPAKPNHSPG